MSIKDLEQCLGDKKHYLNAIIIPSATVSFS